MLSKKVTCAIKIFHVLYHTEQILNGRKCVNENFLADTCDIDYDTFRKVYAQLRTYSYLDKDNNCVILLKAFGDISVYELFFLFHKGIPLGEEVERDYHGLDHLSNPKFISLVDFELDMKQAAERRFKQITMESIFKPFDDDDEYIPPTII